MAEKTLPQRILFLSKIALCASVLMLISACGGQSYQLPQDGSITPGPATISVPPVNPYLNAGMIGQTWAFRNSDGSCTTWINPQSIPLSNYYASGSIDLRFTKSGQGCYWASGENGAGIDFVLSQMSDGRFNAPGWVAHFPAAPPLWCPFTYCSQEVQPPAGALVPYQIVPPPSLSAGQTIAIETSYNVWFFNGENFNSFISGYPWNNVYWKTVFSIDPLTGWAISEQWEGQCGHERWYFSSRGIESIEFPNDGSPSCIPNPPSTTIMRIS